MAAAVQQYMSAGVMGSPSPQAVSRPIKRKERGAACGLPLRQKPAVCRKPAGRGNAANACQERMHRGEGFGNIGRSFRAPDLITALSSHCRDSSRKHRSASVPDAPARPSPLAE